MNGLLFLYGPPASGKTTLGARLAAALGCRFLDLDEEIERRAGMPVGEIFARDGEPAFRKIEGRTLADVVAARDATPGGMVVALGGGTLLDVANRNLAESAGNVWRMETPPRRELERRLASQPGKRPLGDKSAERAAHYASFRSTVAETFDLGDSLVVIGEGLAGIARFARLAVADSNVAPIVRDGLDGTPLHVIAAGEGNKRPDTVAGIWRAMHGHGLGRRDYAMAIGGGVTGDLTGFAAATWMRGIPWINAPTSLLAMVDASTGGKTGCDLDEGKNLVGAFHPPRLVAIDVLALRTLPKRELVSGQAEMIKHEVISGRLRTSISEMPSAREIADNLSVKVEIVREDPKETRGRRLLLNCGHTVGHALEVASGYSISHGEAVAAGCVEEARIAARLGLAGHDFPAELEGRFRAAGLTASTGRFSLGDLAPYMRSDKKRVGNKVAFALPCAFGDVRPVMLDPGNLP